MNKQAVMIEINNELKAKIQAESKRLQIPMAAYIRLVLMQHMEGARDDHSTKSILQPAG